MIEPSTISRYITAVIFDAGGYPISAARGFEHEIAMDVPEGGHLVEWRLTWQTLADVPNYNTLTFVTYE